MIATIDITPYRQRLKATIQQTGRLGFTEATAKALALTRQAHVQFARDDEGDRALYMILREGQVDNSFRVMKAGQYFYLSTKRLCDCNGNEIYEGDILREGENVFVQVVYDAPQFCYKDNDFGYKFLNHPENFEVIGNIHENSGLLEGGRNGSH